MEYHRCSRGLQRQSSEENLDYEQVRNDRKIVERSVRQMNGGNPELLRRTFPARQSWAVRVRPRGCGRSGAERQPCHVQIPFDPSSRPTHDCKPSSEASSINGPTFQHGESRKMSDLIPTLDGCKNLSQMAWAGQRMTRDLKLISQGGRPMAKPWSAPRVGQYPGVAGGGGG
ncbi:hypothetical protein RRG08_010016 [Elysia crispata]|uniref:Uncharacterized protein n=1 Tax=Elysia crispata TaxID=231223 RepID=A0AAE0YQD9_9GAST|nr:hypothetical protein RRG08_010016 [Elysia crispata]